MVSFQCGIEENFRYDYKVKSMGKRLGKATGLISKTIIRLQTRVHKKATVVLENMKSTNFKY